MRQPELIIEDMVPQGRPVDADETELRTLADDIHKHGLKHPILVMDGIVVDGLKRVEAFKLLGRARIQAMVTTNFGEATAYLQKVRGTSKFGTRRQIEIAEQLEPFRARFHKRRFNADVVEDDAKKSWANIPSRTLLARALGRSESSTEALLFLLKNVQIPEVGRRLALIKKGEDTIHGLRQWVAKSHPYQDFADASVPEITTAMNRGFQDLNTTLDAMSKYGAMSALSRRQRAQVLSEVDKVRRQLYRLAKEVRTGLQLEAKEGKRDE